jgi:hypothetical protein
MKKKSILICIAVCTGLMFSCLSEEEKKARQEQKLALQLAEEKKEEQRLKELARQKAIQDSLDAVRLEQESKEKEIYEKYINNSLQTGATPYAYLYGYNKRCDEWGCSQIKVTTPSSSEVLVLIKRNNKVIKHAYIRASSTYTFEMPNGMYQPFFYYGKGWNPDKIMKKTDKGLLKGGFISNEHFGKDNPQTLKNNILEYELILQQHGNFSEKSSSKEEAF